MSLVPAELLLALAAVFTVVKIAAEQQQSARKPVPIRDEVEEDRTSDHDESAE